VRELARFTLVGWADRICCPALALAGEGDLAGTGQLAAFAQALGAPVTTHEFTVAEGAGGHREGLGQDRRAVRPRLADRRARPLERASCRDGL